MNRLLLAIALATLLLPAVAPLAAQEDADFNQLTREIRDRMKALEGLLNEQAVDLERSLSILDELTAAGGQMRKSAPMTAHDNALQAIERAQGIAEAEPPLPDRVSQVLESCRTEVERQVIGEDRSATAARFLSPVLALETATNEELRRFAHRAGEYRQLMNFFAMGGDARLAKASQYLDRLYVLHSAAVQAIEK